MDNAGYATTIKQMLSVFIEPEIKRRTEAGLLAPSFQIKMFQILFSPDLKKPVVRLNEETNILASIQLRRPIDVKNGQVIVPTEVAAIEWLGLSPQEEDRYGHFSAIRAGNAWTFSWDARYNKGLARQHLANAKEFYRSALDNWRRRRLKPFVDNLFSCIELAAKAELLLVPYPGFGVKTGHGAVQMRYNAWVKIGNANSDFAWASNFLTSKRGSARYLHNNLVVTNEESKKLIGSSWRMIRHVQGRLKKHR